MEVTIVLAGNPNSGKTTLFNALTGARQHVGNYPGVTVEKKQGTYIYNGYHMHIVDLPGTYSLTTYSIEEVVARDFLTIDRPEVVIDIVDASNLERNLYLAVQFLELGVPLCIALNMVDVAKIRKIEIDEKKLSKLLGIPVVPTIARTGHGKKELMEAAIDIFNGSHEAVPLEISYGADLDRVIMQMEEVIRSSDFLTESYPARWIAIKYLENDSQIRSKGRKRNPTVATELEGMVRKVSSHLKATLETDPEALISDYRYGYINAIIKKGIIHRRYDQNRLYTTDKIDKILTNRFIGPLIMLMVIIGLYHFTFTYSARPVGWLESIFGWLGNMASAHLSDGLFKSLLVSGVIDGVGGVLGFVPLIMFMFFGIAFLEDSGYLARMAFMLDRVFRAFGLHGSSVMAFIVSGGISGGCAVPGVMATRTLKSPRERLATLLTVPFMNCGAKLPVFALLIATFFAENEAVVMFIITIASWAGALLAAKFLRITIIRGPSTPFVMELPPYRFPTFKGLLIHTWERTWQYIKKAGTVILVIAVILWAMMTFPGLPDSEMRSFHQEREKRMALFPASVLQELKSADDNTQLSAEAQSLRRQLDTINAEEAEAGLKKSIAGRIGAALESITRLAGFDWRTNIALVGGFAAKEVVVSTLGTAYSLGDIADEEKGSLSETLARSPNWTPLIAIALIAFTIFYAPCFVTVVCIMRETGSWKWGIFSMAFNTLLAFILAALIYQVGSAMGF